MNENKILILDFGSQYTQLIARRIREINVFSEILNHDVSVKNIIKKNPTAIILSGGPMSVYDEKAYTLDSKIFKLKIPILGICYGMQLLMKEFGSVVSSSDIREFGKMNIRIKKNSGLFKNISNQISVWMSHGDKISKYNNDWEVLANSDNDIIAAVKLKNKNFYGVQFHPEVAHTQQGLDILKNFAFEIAQCKPSWTSKNFILKTIESIKNEVGKKEVICGISGGVDSTVMGALINKAIGNQAHFIFINHGLLRKNEELQVINSLRSSLGMKINSVDVSNIF